MSKKYIYYIVEPSNIMPAWITEGSRCLYEIALQKHFSAKQLHLDDSLTFLGDGTPVIVFCTTNKWTEYAISQLLGYGAKPIVIGVAIDKFAEDISGVTMNRRAFMTDILHYFEQYGRRRPALFGISSQISNDVMKAESFIRTGTRMSLGVSEDDIYYVGEDCENLEKAAEQFWARRSRYDSVICANDFFALHLLSQASSHQISVPDDLWVSGYGNYLIGLCSAPTITSAAIDTRALALQGVNIYKQLITSSDISHIITSIDCAIIPRGTTASAPVSRERQVSPRSPAAPSCRTLTGAAGILHNLENCLCQCDELDAKILSSILRGDSYEQIADDLFISGSTFRYRLKKLFRLLNVAGRTDFEQLMANYKINSANILNLFLPKVIST